jgi:hypothetical protein
LGAVRFVRVLLATGALLIGAGCSSDDQPAPVPSSTTTAPQPLDLEQAQRLASMRPANYRAGAGAFTTTIRVDGDSVSLSGVVDWHTHAGSAVFRAAGRTDAGGNGLMQWDFRNVAAHPGGVVDGPPPAAPADGNWQVRSLDPTSSALDTLFLLLLNLAGEQADNPQLLQQGDSRFIGTEVIDGAETWIIRGPSAADAGTSGGGSLTYSIWDDGRVARVRAQLGSEVVTVDFDSSAPPAVQLLPDIGGEG